MDFMNKIEDLINKLLLRFQELFWLLVQKITPAPVKRWIELYRAKKAAALTWLKKVPGLLKTWGLKKITDLKATLKSLDVKSKLVASYNAALARTKTDGKTDSGKFSALKKILLAPVLVVSQWLQGLSAAQSLMLLGFTAASVLSVFSISFEGQRLLKQIESSRAPASAVEDEYARPEYYKKQTRHVQFTNLRLPVFVAEVNELRSVDIDFIATLSTREAKLWLERQEFQLRDHLILNVEPLAAAFPLEEEGKEIIRQKLKAEVAQYLIDHKIKAEVIELKLTYILAN